ncbi:NADH ubiquinone oxidoreductase subunit NDUFA12-domain-containing protein, partial [Phlyctochytrium arcticum]
QPRVGTLVGRDEAGNSYYENREDIVLRDRWVEYKSWNPDASQVPAEWHQWLHRITDEVPNPENIPRPFFSPPHIENLTGSTGAFKTYNTTVPKYNSWTPGTKARQG